MEKRKKLVTLFGKAGSGKDTLLKAAVNQLPLKPVIHCTTRPMREGEKNGVDYNFIGKDRFLEKILNLDMLETTQYDVGEETWLYGTEYSALHDGSINIGIFNLDGLNCLLEDKFIDICPIYIDVSDKERLYRQLTRENNPNCKEICRRFLADEEDFSNSKIKDFHTYYNVDENDLKEFPKILKNLLKEYGWI